MPPGCRHSLPHSPPGMLRFYSANCIPCQFQWSASDRLEGWQSVRARANTFSLEVYHFTLRYVQPKVGFALGTLSLSLQGIQLAESKCGMRGGRECGQLRCYPFLNEATLENSQAHGERLSPQAINRPTEEPLAGRGTTRFCPRTAFELFTFSPSHD